MDHLIVVEAELRDQKGNFIIDTDSETLILNKVHFKSSYVRNKKSDQTYGVFDIIDDPLKKKLKQFKYIASV